MLVLTLLIMGIATFLIGLLPTYQSIGLWLAENGAFYLYTVFILTCATLPQIGFTSSAVLTAISLAAVWERWRSGLRRCTGRRRVSSQSCSERGFVTAEPRSGISLLRSLPEVFHP
jgi:hypothetical protein